LAYIPGQLRQSKPVDLVEGKEAEENYSALDDHCHMLELLEHLLIRHHGQSRIGSAVIGWSDHTRHVSRALSQTAIIKSNSISETCFITLAPGVTRVDVIDVAKHPERVVVTRSCRPCSRAVRLKKPPADLAYQIFAEDAAS
jgi:hypothetical protein